MKGLKIRQELFWDMDFHTMDPEVHRVTIVQQVLNYGTIEELRELIRFYGKGQVVSAIKQAGWFDPKTFSFIIRYFGIEKNDMQCYTKKRLNQPHWS